MVTVADVAKDVNDLDLRLSKIETKLDWLLKIALFGGVFFMAQIHAIDISPDVVKAVAQAVIDTK